MRPKNMRTNSGGCVAFGAAVSRPAVLGDSAASVLTDQARMKGTLRSTDNHTYVCMRSRFPCKPRYGSSSRPPELFLASRGRDNFLPICRSYWAPIMSRRSRLPRPNSAASTTRADRHQHARLSIPANRPSPKFSRGWPTSRSCCPTAYKPAISAKEKTA